MIKRILVKFNYKSTEIILHRCRLLFFSIFLQKKILCWISWKPIRQQINTLYSTFELFIYQKGKFKVDLLGTLHIESKRLVYVSHVHDYCAWLMEVSIDLISYNMCRHPKKKKRRKVLLYRNRFFFPPQMSWMTLHIHIKF